MIQPAHGTSRRLQLGDEEQIDERLARRAHELEGRLAKFGTAGIQKPKDLLEFVNNLYFYNTTTTTTTTGEAEYYTAGAGCIMYNTYYVYIMYNTYYVYNTYNTVLCIHLPWRALIWRGE